MTFPAYLAAHPDNSARYLSECLSGLAGEANGIADVCAHLQATLAPSEAVLACEEVAHLWAEWERERGLQK